MIHFRKLIKISIFLVIFIVMSCSKKEIRNNYRPEYAYKININNSLDSDFCIPTIDWLSQNPRINLLNYEIDIQRKIEKLKEKHGGLYISEFGNPEICYDVLKSGDKICYEVKTNHFDISPRIGMFVFHSDNNIKYLYDEYCQMMIQHGFIVLIDYEDFISGEITIRKDNIFKVTELAYEDFEEYKEILLQNPEKLVPVDSDFIKN